MIILKQASGYCDSAKNDNNDMSSKICKNDVLLFY